MISVLLILLKIIGIVLLVLLGLFLVLLMIVLFVPVRYRLKGYYKDAFVFKGKISWLLHIVSISIDYNNKMISSVKIFGIDASRFLSNKTTHNNKTENVAKEQDINIRDEKKLSAHINTEDSSFKYPIEDIASQENRDNIAAEDDNEYENPSLWQNIVNKIKGLYRKAKNRFESLYIKIKNFFHACKYNKEKLKRYIQIIQKEEVSLAFSLCKNRIFKMIKHIAPKKIKIQCRIGMEDPSITGYLIGLYNLLSEKRRKQIIMEADFEKPILEGEFYISGFCNSFTILYQILCIISNSNCRSFYKLLKKEIANE